MVKVSYIANVANTVTGLIRCCTLTLMNGYTVFFFKKNVLSMCNYRIS